MVCFLTASMNQQQQVGLAAFQRFFHGSIVPGLLTLWPFRTSLVIQVQIPHLQFQMKRSESYVFRWQYVNFLDIKPNLS